MPNDVAAAKRRVLGMLSEGKTRDQAMDAVGRTTRTFESWMLKDESFKHQVGEVRELLKGGGVSAPKADGTPAVEYVGAKDLGFAEWRKEFLGRDTFPHQQQWVDVLEGKEPTPIEGCEWDPRNTSRLIINVPPFHAKSATITTDYVTYRICMDPNVRVIIISKRQEQARKFLHQIKQRLTAPRFAKLQAAYAPDGGFKPDTGEGSFAANIIYVSGVTADEKDPTVEVLGMGSQIYGSRADLIIMDDCVVGANAHDYEKQIYWIESEVESRVKNGKIVLVGTRLQQTDLYSELRQDERYLSGRSPWSYLRQPMVLGFADDPKDWTTLWPRTTTPMETGDEPNTDGWYTAWDGAACAKVRDSKPPTVWSLVYQQTPTVDDATFPPELVNGAVDRRRKPGPLRPGDWGGRVGGREGTYTIASMDPAMAGDTFVLVGSVDRDTKYRWIENAWVQTRPSATWIREIIKSVTDEYHVNEWVIESNAFQLFLTQDPEVNTFLQSRGVRLTPHYTSGNKQDPDFGVASLAPLFGRLDRLPNNGRVSHVADSNLIRLPDTKGSQGLTTLVEELCTWQPGIRGSKLAMDGPMALWFFDLRARSILGENIRGTGVPQFRKNRFLSRGRARKQMVVSTAAGWG